MSPTEQIPVLIFVPVFPRSWVWIRVYLWWTCRTHASTAFPTCTLLTTCWTRHRAPSLDWAVLGALHYDSGAWGSVIRVAWPQTRSLSSSSMRQLLCTCRSPSRTLCSTWLQMGLSTMVHPMPHMPHRSYSPRSPRTGTQASGCQPLAMAGSLAVKISQPCAHRTALCSLASSTHTATVTTTPATTRLTTHADSYHCRCRYAVNIITKKFPYKKY